METINEQLVIPLRERSSDLMVRARAARFAGSVAIRETIELEQEQPFNNLHDALVAAQQGDQLALSMVRANVAQDVTERTLKAGFVSDKSYMQIDNYGTFSQFGQSYRSVMANSLRWASDHPVMAKRILAENNNNYRLEELVRQDMLEDNYFVVFSRCEDDEKLGFFTETMSCAVQVTTKEGDALSTETAFVAGKHSGGIAFEEHVITELYQQLSGVDISGLSPAEVIDRPLLIPKSLIPDGVIDLVKLYDVLAGSTFFGLDVPRQGYANFKEKCREIEQSYTEITQTIINELLESLDSLKSPLDVVKKLNQLSEFHTVKKATVDDNIDPRVFGQPAALHIYAAREAIRQGDVRLANREVAKARASAASDSCPAVLSGGVENGSAEDGESDEYGSLSFYCPKGHLNTRNRGELLPKCQTEGCEAVVKCA